MANFGSQMGSFIPRDQLWGVLVKLAPWGVAHCNSLRPGRRCLARTESSTAVRGTARAPPRPALGPRMASTHPTCGYRLRLSLAFKLHAELTDSVSHSVCRHSARPVVESEIEVIEVFLCLYRVF